MAFKHISANRLSFLLTSDGAPSGLLVNGENIPIGSLAIDRINGKTYQLKPTLNWVELGSGGNAGTSGGAVPTSIIEELLTASTSAPYIFNLAFTPRDGTVKVFVNGLLATPFPITNNDYTLTGLTITWSLTPQYNIDPLDQIVVYYDTFDI